MGMYTACPRMKLDGNLTYAYPETHHKSDWSRQLGLSAVTNTVMNWDCQLCALTLPAMQLESEPSARSIGTTVTGYGDWVASPQAERMVSPI